jgi:serine/threonine protein kinase
MLDDSFKAKLGDFGLICQVDSSVPQQTLTVGGTHAYLEPEYFETKKVSLESDVYSFGVVVLQMVLGEKPSWIVEKESQRLRNYFVEKAFGFYRRGEILRKVDKQLKGQFDQKQMKRVIHIGLLCVHADRKKRPNSSQALFFLTEPETELPPVLSAGVTPAASASTVGNDGSPAGPSSSAPSISRQQSDEFRTCRGDFN